MHSIPYIQSLEEFEKHHLQQSFDYLFSIANSKILSDNILNHPTKYAINYHNSPLPKYAGLYATTWAILNDEKNHAISWHIMNKEVDAGDLLKRPWFPIEEDETALSLNLKCYEHAIKAFGELIEELATNTETLLKQDLTSRSYYGLKYKPETYGFIVWNNTADTIDRLCRALTFGDYKNELVTPKILINDHVFVVKSYRKLHVSSGKIPGSIVHLSSTDLQISTLSTDIVFYELMGLCGKIFQMEELIEQFGLSVGQNLSEINSEDIEELKNNPSLNSPVKEKFWVNEFTHCIDSGLSFLSQLQKNSHSTLKKMTLSVKSQKAVRQYSENHHVLPKDILLSLLIIYLYRLNNYGNFTFHYHHKATNKNRLAEKLIANDRPFTTQLKSSMCFDEVVTNIKTEISRLTRKGHYGRDIFIRYPELHALTEKIDLSLSMTERLESQDTALSSKISFYLPPDNTSILIENRTNYMQKEESYAFFNFIEHHLVALLKDVLKNPDKKLFELRFIEKNERDCLLKQWNDTEASFETNCLLHYEIEESAAKYPNAIAAFWNDKTLTYQDLNEQSNQLAHCLLLHDVKPNDIIGIYCDRSALMLIAILGILKAGAAYLPLDINYPDKRISYMLQNSQSSILLTTESVKNNSFEEFSGQILELPTVFKSEEWSKETPKIKTKPSNLAYVIYTSGTTGTPKGVSISHQAICNHMAWMKEAYPFSNQDIFLQKTPFSFDASVWEFFMPLWVGGILVIAPSGAHTNPKDLIKLVIDYEVTVLQLVPSMLREMTLTNGFSDCTSLKYIFCGGEILLQEIIHSFYEHSPTSCTLHNLYGPTEATIDSLTFRCTPHEAHYPLSRIGTPISNMKAYILDDHLQLVPTGIVGELYLSGAGLAEGYLNNEPLTKQKFIKNPFSIAKHERLYKTGDLVKWQSNGIVEYHERKDSQIKIRGFRIEISEIESCLGKIPAIYQCMVKPENTNNNGTTLSAYLVLIKNHPISVKDIRDTLQKELPEYMIPSRFFIVEKLLTTASGKLDRKHVLKPIAQLYSHKEHLSPQTKTEKKLHSIWCLIMNLQDVGIYDDFFEIGGHSLIAMNIINRIQDNFKINLSMRSLFNNPSIHSLALEIDQLLLATNLNPKELSYADKVIIPLKKSGTKTPLFLIHPIGGSIFWYKALEKYIDKQTPLYGIQDPGLEKNALLFNSIEQMASFYIQTIQIIQPHGPYLIGGASFGSTVAIEMANQLQKMNEKLIAIISLDGWAEYPALQRNEGYFKELMREQNARILERHRQFNLINSEALVELQWHREKMLINYKLPHIHCHFELFKAEILTEIFNYEAPYNWWENFISGTLNCHLVPGNHESMFSEPHICILADKLNKFLNTIRQ